MSLRATHIVFVHGLFGWGPDDFGGKIPYWGDALTQFEQDFTVHEAKVGPISSFHDRACELYAQIAGGQVDYGETHSTDAGHARHSRSYAKGFVDNWSAANPIILVGHSAGAHTCLQLQALLANKFFDKDNSADMVEAVICVSGVVNGTLLPYVLACDPNTGRVSEKKTFGVLSPSELISTTLEFIYRLLARLPGFVRAPIDLMLDQWTGTREFSEKAQEALNKSSFVKGEDNLAYDLTLQGCHAANEKFKTHPGTYYLSLVSDATRFRGPFGLPWLKSWRADGTFRLAIPALQQANFKEFDPPGPIPNWGKDDLHIEKWRSNDGAVSAVSQRYPFTAHSEPVGGEGVLERANIDRGKWYFERLENTGTLFDHFDLVIGAVVPDLPQPKFGMRELHQDVWKRLCARLVALR